MIAEREFVKVELNPKDNIPVKVAAAIIRFLLFPILAIGKLLVMIALLPVRIYISLENYVFDGEIYKKFRHK